MLFIFRQLRRLELRQKSGRYFVYALGEVILIVVGILIALQIQNWNQSRLDRTEERYLLEELVDNLNQEAERFEEGIASFKAHLEHHQSIRGFIENGTGSPEAFTKNIPRLVGGFTFSPVSSAYESMKNGRIGFSNRELKAELVQYYDIDRNVLERTLGQHMAVITNQVEPLFAKYIKSFHGTRSTGLTAVPKDIDDPEFQEAILGVVTILEPRTLWNLDRVETLLKRNREILALVEQELEEL